jgi:hypothetical protein
LREVSVACSFLAEDFEERCNRAAQILADPWHSDDPKKGEMRSALVPQLRMHFRSKLHEIGFDMVLLVAEPRSDQLKHTLRLNVLYQTQNVSKEREELEIFDFENLSLISLNIV